jgi:Zn-dependent protease with chaperone function
LGHGIVVQRVLFQLIFLAGLFALTAVGALISAIFKRPKVEHTVQGRVIEKDSDLSLWHELDKICSRVGTELPDQVVMGIDDNFFVTEMPIAVSGKTCHGRTLYVSLSLLKQMNADEVDAVLAHEMAHFSGEDTVYSKKIAPLLVRYSHYLDALGKGFAWPIYHYMNCFRALYELSLSKFGRQREFRADQIAMQVTSPFALAVGLLRIVAYSHFRNNVQQELFQEDHSLGVANIRERTEAGFQTFAKTFASTDDVAKLESAHPFDRHPSVSLRLEAAGFQFDREQLHAMLAAPGDGRWYEKIANAEQFEREEWSEFEHKFREAHEQSLPFRFVPKTQEEMAVVVKAFPEIEIDGKSGSVVINFEAIHYATWKYPVMFSEITHIALDREDVLQIKYEREGKRSVSIKVKDFADMRQNVLDTLARYYGRYKTAVAHQAKKSAEPKQEEVGTTSSVRAPTSSRSPERA